MVKVPPPSVSWTFQGRRDWPIGNEIDDWGLTPQQQESYVEQFRRLLEAKKAWKESVHDYFTLRRFLRARSYDLEKATTMWLNHLNWQKEFGVETILQDFYFHERDQFLLAYPQGYHKLDKMGRPIYIQQLGKINVSAIKKACSEDRMLKFHIQEYERCRKVILPICSRLAGHQIDQTFGIMDVAGVGLSLFTGEVKRLMGLVTKYDQDNYPEMLGHICIINAPGVFRMIWAFAKGLIDIRTQNKIEILGTDYKEALLKWVDEENLPEWIGGKSKGTLIDDVGPWSDAELCAKIGVNIEDLRAGKTLPPLLADGGRQSSLGSSRRFSAPSARIGQGSQASQMGVVPSFVRVSSDVSDGYQSPLGSSADLGSRRPSGVPNEVLEDAARRYAASVGSTNLMQPSNYHLAPIQEPSTRGPRTLIDRIAALERQFPPHMERLKKDMPMTANGAVGHGGVGAASTRSAPEGSLLNRVEVLEEAMEALLDAQEASLQYQQQQADLAAQRQKQPPESSCCCTIM